MTVGLPNIRTKPRRESHQTTKAMWASSPMLSRPSPPCVPTIGIPSSNTTPVQRNLTFAISIKFQRRQPPPNDDRDHDTTTAKRIGSLGHSVLTAPKSNPQDQNSASSSIKITNPKQQQKSAEKEERELSGSDVLLALQRASAQKKIKKKRREVFTSSSSTIKTRGKEKVDDEVEDLDYGDVRPICIKSEWNTRLDELEKRLQELTDEIH